jgi:hypothetical protein
MKVPGVLGVGEVREKLASPYVFVKPLQVNVGVALPTVTVMEVVPPELKFAVSDGVNVAVIKEVPTPATVAVLPLIEIADVVPDA